MNLDDGYQLHRACDSSDPRAALQLLSSWDQQRIQAAAVYKDEEVRAVLVEVSVSLILGTCHSGPDVGLTKSCMCATMCVWLCPQLGYTPLHYACDNGHLGAIVVVLEQGADVQARNIVSITPRLLSACMM